jgi:predicted RNA methylase
MTLNGPEVIIHCARGITVELESAEKAVVKVGQVSKSFSADVLRVFSVFAHPLSLKEGFKQLPVKGVNEWVTLMNLIRELLQIGALKSSGESRFVPDKDARSFGAPAIHATMLNDRARTDGFVRGIFEVVKVGDVVLDIGTGSGILAIMAARAGARHVYAIEASTIADAAQATIDATEVADKITLIRGWSTNIDLPEKADVLVSEIIGNDPFDENILAVFKDAHKRHLHSGARILPGKIRVFALQVTIPASFLVNKTVSTEDLQNWKSWYGIDFSAMATSTFPNESALIWVDDKYGRNISTNGEPFLLCEVDFAEVTSRTVRNTVAAKASAPFNGLLLFFELHLGSSWITNRPAVTERAVHWSNPVWYLPTAMEWFSGKEFSVDYSWSGKTSSLRIC